MFTSLVLALALGSATSTAAPLQRSTSTGQATYYAVGLGACGGTNSDSEAVVALNAAQYGSGAYCGQTVIITDTETGNTASATIVDLCPGCGEGSLDLSPSLFSTLSNGNMDEGVFPISWTFGSGGGSTGSTSTSARASASSTAAASTRSATSIGGSTNNSANEPEDASADSSSADTTADTGNATVTATGADASATVDVGGASGNATETVSAGNATETESASNATETQSAGNATETSGRGGRKWDAGDGVC
ncbi:hypothetical protein Q5752_005078 [Cryptotrichosporon argae]